MKYPKIEIVLGWRVVFFLVVSIFLCGCSGRLANVTKGSFETNLPEPFLGAGTYIYPDEFRIRGTLSYNTRDKETLALEGVINEASSQFPEEDADIDLTVQKHPFSGSVDFIYKLEKWLFTLGGNMAINPYPSISVFAGINGLYGECGFALGLDYLRSKAIYSGHYVSMDDNWLDRKSEGDFEEGHYQKNINLSLFTYSSIFITSKWSLNFSTGLYLPFVWDEVYLGNVEEPGDYDAMLEAGPFIFSQYAGATLTLLNRVQLRAGEMVYYTIHSDEPLWQTNISVSFFVL